MYWSQFNGIISPLLPWQTRQAYTIILPPFDLGKKWSFVHFSSWPQYQHLNLFPFVIVIIKSFFPYLPTTDCLGQVSCVRKTLNWAYRAIRFRLNLQQFRLIGPKVFHFLKRFFVVPCKPPIFEQQMYNYSYAIPLFCRLVFLLKKDLPCKIRPMPRFFGGFFYDFRSSDSDF